MNTGACWCWRGPAARLWTFSAPAAFGVALIFLLLPGPAEAQLSQPPVNVPFEPWNVAPGEPLSPMALVSQPGAIKGVQSWTLETRRHRGPIYAMALSPGQQFMATGGLDGTIRIWQTESGQFLRALVGHEYGVGVLSWSPDGNTLASVGGSDSTARLWNLRAGLPLRILRGHKGYVSHVVWSPDGKTLITAGGHSGFVTRWEAVSGKQTRTVELGRPITGVAWSPDGKTLACSGQEFAVQLWDAFLAGPPRGLTQAGETTINTVAWSPDGKTLAGSDNKKTYLWDPAAAKQMQAWDFPSQSMAWSPDGNLLATLYQKTIRFHDAESGKVNKTLQATAQTLSWPASSSRLFARGPYRVSLWDVSLAADKPAHTVEVGDSMSLTWNPGKHVIGGVGGQNLTVWDTATGTKLALLEGPKNTATTTIAWSPKDKTLATAGSDKMVRLWEAATGQQLATLEGHSAPVGALAWSPSGKKLASASSDKTVRIWETGTGKPLATLAQENPVRTLAWSPDGKFLASGDNQLLVHLWRGDKGPPAFTLKPQKPAKPQYSVIPIHGLAWSPSGKFLATGDYNAIRFWEFPGGRLAQNPVAIGYTPPNLAWSPSGALLAVSGQHAVPIWDVRTGKATHSFIAAAPVHHVAWTSSGAKIGASLTTRTVLFWNTSSKQRQGAYVSTEQWIAAITAKGHFGATPGVDNDLVYVALTEGGLETIEPKVFAAKHAWKNNPTAPFGELAAK